MRDIHAPRVKFLLMLGASIELPISNKLSFIINPLFLQLVLKFLYTNLTTAMQLTYSN